MSDMTRKDAIRRLKRLLKCGDGTYEFKVEINTDDQKAIQFAIDSLETDEAYQLMYEQPELCEDCISREATKEAIRKRFPSLHDRCEVNIVINSMPSILPKTNFNYSPASEWEHDHEILKAYSDGQASIITVLEDIKAEMENLKDNRCFCHHYERGINECINVLNKHMESEDKE